MNEYIMRIMVLYLIINYFTQYYYLLHIWTKIKLNFRALGVVNEYVMGIMVLYLIINYFTQDYYLLHIHLVDIFLDDSNILELIINM
jgi:hypothetical protein